MIWMGNINEFICSFSKRFTEEVSYTVLCDDVMHMCPCCYHTTTCLNREKKHCVTNSSFDHDFVLHISRGVATQYFSYFSTKTYFVGTQKIYFCVEIRIILIRPSSLELYFHLSEDMFFYMIWFIFITYFLSLVSVHSSRKGAFVILKALIFLLFLHKNICCGTH